MNRILPNIYKGIVNKKNNQKEVKIINKDNMPVEQDREYNKKNINEKINDIFNSPRFIYKADVLIELTSGEKIKKTIIGKNNNSLITMDNSLIEISSINQIDLI